MAAAGDARRRSSDDAGDAATGGQGTRALRVLAWATVALMLAGGLMLWRSHGLAVFLSAPAWLCVT